MIADIPFSWEKKHNMLICSAASGGRHMEMLKVVGPTLSFYAHIHQMDCFLLPLNDQRLADSRPPAWDKVVLLYHAIQIYDYVMWVDCDSIICDPFHDIRDDLTGSCCMYLVRQDLSGIPNTGVWVLRKGEQTNELLLAIWNNTEFIHHPWWEQGSLMNLMGYGYSGNENPHEGLTYNPTAYDDKVGVLDKKWNSCDSKVTEQTIIKHYCGERNEYVVEWLKSDYNRFLEKVNSATCNDPNF